MPNLDRDFRWLLNLDGKRRSNYLEPELDDRTHFIHAVEEDIISNAVYLDFALRYIPIDTIGMASSCRTIMEALVLIQASDAGAIPEENYKRFRDEHVFIEYSNAKRLFELLPENVGGASFKKLSEDYERLAKEYCDELGMKRSEFARLAKDPMFILFKKGNHTLKSFDSLIHRFQREWVSDYRFLGMEVHPHFLMDDNLEKEERKQVKELAMSLLTDAMNYLKERYRKEMEEGEAKTLGETVSDPLYYGPWFIPLNKEVEALQAFLANAIVFPDGIDAYTLYAIEKLTYLYYGMESMAILGFREHAAMKFKSAVENMAYFYLINEAKEGMVAFNAQKESFNVSSEIQYLQLLKGKEQDFAGLYARLQAVYESYYKEKYNVTFDEFKDKVFHDGKYFFSDDSTFSFRKLVHYFLDDYLGENELAKRNILFVYDTSVDMEHAGGYLMESSVGPWEQNYYVVMKFFCDFFLLWMSEGIAMREEAEKPADDLKQLKNAFEQTASLAERLKKESVNTYR